MVSTELDGALGIPIAPVATVAWLHGAHAAIERSIRAGRESELRVVGAGEITTVVAWPPSEPFWAVKRLPRCGNAHDLSAYARVVEAYVLALRRAGVTVLATRCEAIEDLPHGCTGYLIQPLLPGPELLVQRLRRATDGEALPWLDEIARSVVDVTAARLGLDAHVANWAVGDGTLTYFDVSTPLIRDEAGREALDLKVFLAALPPGVRVAFRALCLRSVLNRYYDRTSVARDFVSSLYQRRLSQHVPAAVRCFHRRGVTIPGLLGIRVYSWLDTLLWRVLRVARRAHRWFSRDLLGRPYGELLSWS